MVQKKSVSKPAAKKTAKPAAKAAAAKPAKGGKSATAAKAAPAKAAAKPPKKIGATKAGAATKAAPAKKAIAKPAATKAAVKTPAKTGKPVPKPIPAPKQEVMKKEKIEKKIPSNGKIADKTPVSEKEMPVELSERMAYGMYGGIEVCKDPKPFPKKTPYTEREIKTIREILVEERTRLRDVLRSLDEMTLRRPNDEVDSTIPTHLAENATDNQNTETALLLRRDQESALRQVESAIERLEGGLFGVCLGCGLKIGIDRLKAKPEAHLCMSCQRVYAEKTSGR